MEEGAPAEGRREGGQPPGGGGVAGAGGAIWPAASTSKATRTRGAWARRASHGRRRAPAVEPVATATTRSPAAWTMVRASSSPSTRTAGRAVAGSAPRAPAL